MTKNIVETPQEKQYREIAENISSLAKSVKSLLNGPFNRKALLILLAHSSGQSQGTVKSVLEALETMESDWLNKKSK